MIFALLLAQAAGEVATPKQSKPLVVAPQAAITMPRAYDFRCRGISKAYQAGAIQIRLTGGKPISGMSMGQNSPDRKMEIVSDTTGLGLKGAAFLGVREDYDFVVVGVDLQSEETHLAFEVNGFYAPEKSTGTLIIRNANRAEMLPGYKITPAIWAGFCEYTATEQPLAGGKGQ